MQKKLSIFSLVSILLMLVVGCAPGAATQINVPGMSIELSTPGANPAVNTADANQRIAGVLQGVWHGIISPVTLVLSFVNPEIQMYEVHNDGSGYNLGYLLGVAIVFVLLGVLAGSRR